MLRASASHNADGWIRQTQRPHFIIFRLFLWWFLCCELSLVNFDHVSLCFFVLLIEDSRQFFRLLIEDWHHRQLNQFSKPLRRTLLFLWQWHELASSRFIVFVSRLVIPLNRIIPQFQSLERMNGNFSVEIHSAKVRLRRTSSYPCISVEPSNFFHFESIGQS